MAIARRRRMRMAGKPLHPTEWCGHDTFALTASVDKTTALHTICSVDDLLDFTNPTIVRIRGSLVVTLAFSSTGATQDQFEAAFGILVVDDALISVNSLLVKEGQERPWLWLDYVHAITEKNQVWNDTTDTVVETSAGRWQEKLVVNTKAMRRVPQNHRIVLATSFNQLAGTPSMVTRGHLRVLIKE